MPIIESRPAAFTSLMPLSPQKAIRCVPTRPLVVKPQMKKVANKYQKVRVAAARRSVPNVWAMKFPCAAGDTGGTSSASAP